jgi:transcriptional regulator with XRE-family HTH domain
MPDGNNNQHGSIIAALRRRLSMTQEEFAHAIGVTVSTVNRWENGHIEPSRLARKAMQELASVTPRRARRQRNVALWLLGCSEEGEEQAPRRQPLTISARARGER